MSSSVLSSSLSMMSLQPKKAPGTEGNRLQAFSNILPLEVTGRMSFYRYEVAVMAHWRPRGMAEDVPFDRIPQGQCIRKNVAERPKDDFLGTQRKEACSMTLKHLTLHNADFEDNVFIYDRAAILHTTKPIPNVDHSVRAFVVPTGRIHAMVDRAAILTFELCKTADDVTHYGEESNRQRLLDILNLVTSQGIYNSLQFFVCFGARSIFLRGEESHMQAHFGQADMPEIGGDKIVQVGMNKSVVEMEGDGNNSLGICVDLKKTAFHKMQPLSEKLVSIANTLKIRPQDIMAPQNIRILSKYLKGLKCVTTHSRHRTVTVAGLSAQPCRELVIEKQDGTSMRMVAYYRDTYNVEIQALDLPAAVDSRGGRENACEYPLDLLSVCPQQIVTSEQTYGEVTSALIRTCAVLPHSRIEQTEKMAWQLSVHAAEASESAGCRFQTVNDPGDFMRKSVKVNARIMPGVTAKVGPRFAAPAAFPQWIAFYASHRPDRDMEKFMKMFMDAARAFGMNVSDHIDHMLQPPAGSDSMKLLEFWRGIFNKCAEGGFKFVLILSDSSFKDHAVIKQCEQEFGILTQEVKAETALAAAKKSQRQTVMNIVRKTNEKLGGVNAIIGDRWGGPLVHDAKTLLVGLIVAQPGRSGRGESSTPTNPAIIAWAANCGGNVELQGGRQKFVGGYIYTTPDDWAKDNDKWESVNDSLVSLFERIIRTFRQSRGVIPERVVVYRGELPEGRFKDVQTTERNLWLKACNNIKNTFRPKFTVIAATKDHSIRLYKKNIVPGDRAPQQNLPPGTIVDTGVVHPERNEFFLIAHTALKGTAMSLRCSVLVDENDFTMDLIERATHALCSLAQITELPTSSPVPLFVAQAFRKRATEQWEQRFFSGELDHTEWDVADINRRYGIGPDHALFNQRINA